MSQQHRHFTALHSPTQTTEKNKLLKFKAGMSVSFPATDSTIKTEQGQKY